MCLGSTDLPLSPLGRLQAALAGHALRDERLTAVFCSRLSRSRQSAQYIGAPVIELPGLEELDAGVWDGLYFDEIMARWPELYALRGSDRSLAIPGAESPEEGLKRFSAAIEGAMKASEGNIALVAHAAVMKLFLCALTDMPPEGAQAGFLPYGSVTRLAWDGGPPRLMDMGLLPRPALDEALCVRLLAAAGAPEAVAAHGAAVAAAALSIADALQEAGTVLNRDLIFAAAMLHDIARDQKDHADAGADWLEALGYAETAGVVRRHHDPDDLEGIDESKVVFIADKLVAGTARTTLERRFELSYEKCATAQALAAHERRRAAAAAVAGQINRICKKEIVV